MVQKHKSLCRWKVQKVWEFSYKIKFHTINSNKILEKERNKENSSFWKLQFLARMPISTIFPLFSEVIILQKEFLFLTEKLLIELKW
jgi:hypothetical protein